MGNRIWKYSSEAGTRKYIVDIAGDLPVILLELDTENSNSIEKTPDPWLISDIRYVEISTTTEGLIYEGPITGF